MTNNAEGLVPTLMELPIFEAEWVLWVLIALSIASVAIMAERYLFYRKHAIDVDAVRKKLSALLAEGDLQGAATYLEKFDSLETNTVLFGLRDYARGPERGRRFIRGGGSQGEGALRKTP